jgi:hypothetical protein
LWQLLFSNKYAPGGFTLEIGELAKKRHSRFLLVIGGFAAHELWTIYK